jgi:hypothetical protein
MELNEIFEISEERMDEIADEMSNLIKNKGGFTNLTLISFAKDNYKGKEYVFALHYAGYLYGFYINKP